MDLEKVALEAVKVKISEIFDKINVSTNIEGKSIVLRINLPDEIMNVAAKTISSSPSIGTLFHGGHLDQEAQDAQNELLGTQKQENT